MSNRLMVLFLANSSAANPKPKPQVAYRGCAGSFEEMWQKCGDHLPVDLHQPGIIGKIFVGRQGDAWIENPSYNSPAAVEWNGAPKSGPIEDFLRRHTEMYFRPVKTAEPVAEVAMT